LSEYEEHRLRESIRAGHLLLRIHAAFDFATIDTALEELQLQLKPLGELITYLPSTDPGDQESIGLDVIFAAHVPLASVAGAVSGRSVEPVPVWRRAPPTSATVAMTPAVRVTGAPPGERSAASSGGAVTAVLSPGGVSAATGAPATVADSGGGGPAATFAGEPEHEAEVEAERPASLRSVSQTVRVDIRKLDALMNIVGELAIARAGITGILERLKADRSQAELSAALHHESRALERKMAELQAGILEVRMVPLGQVFEKLSRVVRKISRQAEKEVRFVVSGADTELDKLIVEELSDPLMHIIRNSIDHGIEAPRERQAAGKPETGTIAVNAHQRGNHVVIDIEDDGRGIDDERILRSALWRGVITSEQASELSRGEIHNLIFLPGVSTKELPDELSGRGVGMDVVKTNIARLSGIIELSSDPGQGTRISITLPITLAIISALVIKVAGRTYAIALNSVLESVLIDPRELKTIERREVYSLRGQTLPLVRLEEVFELPPLSESWAVGFEPLTSGSARGRLVEPLGALAVDRTAASAGRPARQYIVVVGLAQYRLGLVVDELTGQQDIVVKSLGRALSEIPGIAGATELGGQQTVLVLDVAALVEEAVSITSAAEPRPSGERIPGGVHE
jgi:two-component system chemotaxis sensor kinase CheA